MSHVNAHEHACIQRVEQPAKSGPPALVEFFPSTWYLYSSPTLFCQPSVPCAWLSHNYPRLLLVMMMRHTSGAMETRATGRCGPRNPLGMSGVARRPILEVGTGRVQYRESGVVELWMGAATLVRFYFGDFPPPRLFSDPTPCARMSEVPLGDGYLTTMRRGSHVVPRSRRPRIQVVEPEKDGPLALVGRPLWAKSW